MTTFDAVRASLDDQWRSQREIWTRVGLGAERSMGNYLRRLVKSGEALARHVETPQGHGGLRTEYRRRA